MLIDIIQETKDYMSALGYEREDIAWIGGHDFIVPIECFWDSPPQMYDSGYGTQHVAADLIIMFKDNSWLERKEYDGSETWIYKKIPDMPLEISWVDTFVDDGYYAYQGLAYINK